LKPAIDQLRRFGPKCASFHILAQTSDGSAPSRRTANARAAEVEQVLVKAGAAAATIKISLQVGPAPQRVQVNHYGVSGRSYCDPTSKNPAYVDGANCQERYTRCYVQLEDGTVCNYANVPNPNPVQYPIVQ
jgi:hypothetical protein